MAEPEETTGQEQAYKDFNLGNFPPEGSKNVGKFFLKCWEEAKREKISRLGLHQRWKELHDKFRGKRKEGGAFPIIGANYLFKTIQGFCAILTEKYPRAEIEPKQGTPDMQAKILDSETKEWWQERSLQNLLYASTQNFQVYGTTIEKFVFDKKIDTSKVILRDPFNFFPCPGYKLCDLEIPYVCDAYFLDTWDIRSRFNIPGNIHIPADAEAQLFGEDRETTRGGAKTTTSMSNLPTNYAAVSGDKSSAVENKALVVEIWCMDETTDEIPIMGEVQATFDTGEPVFDDQGRPVMTQDVVDVTQRPRYPGGIRKVTICPALMKHFNNGVLDDAKNPNVNWELIEERQRYILENGIPQPVVDQNTGEPVLDPATGQPVIEMIPVSEQIAYDLAHQSLSSTWLYSHYPYSANSSLIDTTQWWGFSIIEQLEELQGRAEAILTKYFAYFDRAMFPIFINPVGSGIKNSDVTNAPGLILNPTIEAAAALGFIEQPSPPKGLLELLQFVLFQMDVISQSPEVTEGRRPKGVSAASAMIALMDKAATLFQPQIWTIDRVVEARGKAHISFVKNFGTKEKPIKVDDEFVKYTGIDLWGTFRYLVESGSSAPITKAGRRQQYIELATRGFMTTKPLLEMLEVPNKVIEEVLEEQSVPGALNILVQAGLPVEIAQQVYQIVLQNPGIGADQSQNPNQQGGTPPKTKRPSQPTGPNTKNERTQSIYKTMDTVG